MVRLHRLTYQFHMGLVRCTITLPVVALDTCCDQIFPCLFTQSRFGKQVIDREGGIGAGAVLAAMTIAAENVLSRKNDFLVGDMNVHAKPHDARERHRHRDRMNLLPVMCIDEFRFAQEKEDNRLLDVANAHGLVVLIEDEHFAAQLAI